MLYSVLWFFKNLRNEPVTATWFDLAAAPCSLFVVALGLFFAIGWWSGPMKSGRPSFFESLSALAGLLTPTVWLAFFR